MLSRRRLLTSALVLTGIARPTAHAITVSDGPSIGCPVCGGMATGPGLPLVTAAPDEDFHPMRHKSVRVMVCSLCGVLFNGGPALPAGSDRVRR